ncbi:aftiphilin isoform X1 [Dermochelys coriacea]|uniref:aftiphilin isoform X1 n=1 Tax=Dermochelys coriacea TaxID=27794 RepID=UPI0018E8FBEC|nr:aftiphilin isoform X1 [Dermochelys coriacea]XP_038250435.1 aftiphilin isoform X1 [Dermochelys coriacea]XP_038250438.1 aftiphilin isoform X1 [Dermochelys coriacea]XP_038250443.1 aftiphilin isoform X1 [Dermochelys coriacea]XP_038250444.1 aftiphilin isoform X1 [Dermochelys coriacea]XP_038250446.1 aftiphilin isoform X1 [Dermochelys coriacea]
MEPDIIRMYSSSPPPLDNGADDDDEFGEFGGFSGVGTSGVGFADFDAPDYSNSKEEFIPTNHFMPIHDYSDNGDSLATFNSVKNGKVKDCTAELSKPAKELSDISTNTSKEKCKSRTSGSSFDVNLEDVKRIGEQKENIGKAEGFSSEGIRTDMKVTGRDLQIDTCNGEKLPCLEILTNGFAALDSVNPQGTEDLDGVSDSKGLKTTSTHSTELSLDSVPSPAEDFVDFAAFSNNETIHLEEPGHKICKAFNEREALNVQENHIINRVAQQSITKEVSSDRSYEYESETYTEDEQACISETSLVDNEVGSNCEQDPTALEHDDFIICSTPQTTEISIGTTENAENTGRQKYCDIGKSKELDFSRANDSLETESINFTKIQNPTSDPAEETDLGDSEDVKNGESSIEFLPCSDSNENDFGDFGTVSGASPAFISDTQESVNDLSLEESSEQSARFSEPSAEFGDFRDISIVLTVDKQRLDHSELNQTLEYRATNMLSDLEVPPLAELENGENSEFGEFDSVPKPQDECSAFQDSDDFADFSSAGCNEAAEWNAFEDEQKESCCWAAFGDEQAAESHYRKETWQSHRTDPSLSIGSPMTHQTDSVALASLEGAVSRQESALSIQTTLLSRLERTFEVCFPSIPVLEIEEEIMSLNLFLEASNKQMRTGETLANSGELMEVWTELQDIHDSYGLRYQWGGSHSNKKLLCSLGIDTRNILFTGNKKQPVIVPMYAAGLGMLEPTKEPLKPISAAEKIASIGQTTPVSPEMSTCTSDQFQESLPPVQFDWSSSGLTNPLDASGGSTLLNLDFFGPVDDSSSSSTTTMPGVDPELYELTTSKLETSNASSKVTDAFARLMSTVEKASTSTRKPKKEEHLSEEAAKVISSLPDLTFMHAKVLMFPATLTPSTRCQEKVD